jgi:phosphoglycerol transferase
MQIPKLSQRVQSAAVYGSALCLALCAAWSVLELRHADLAVPFVYHGDGLWAAAWVKGLIDNRWFMHNHFLGMPGGMDLADFPMADDLHFGFIKLICLATHRFGLALNLYYLCGYLLTTLTALYVLRRFVGPGLPSLVPAILYAFLPYHLMRSEGHLFLTSYYLVPLAIMVTLWVYPGDPVPTANTAASDQPCFGRKKLLAALLICVLVGSAGVYYAAFACFFLIVAGLLAGWVRRSAVPGLLALLFIGLIGATVIANIAPSLVSRARHGANPRVAHGQVYAGEILALKISQLLLPMTQHRVPALADLKATYSLDMPLVNENDTTSLGLVGSLGLLLLLAVPFWRIGAARVSPRLEAWSLLTWAALLLATIGGVGILFNLLVTPQIRCYNRIVVFVAFFCLLAVAAGLRAIADWCRRNTCLRLACAGGMLALLWLGILDQSSPYWAPKHRALKEMWQQDAAFVTCVEGSVPPRTKVFQLPYMPFPEAELVPQRMKPYDPFRLYLHSRTLRWSYGAMKGRASDQWQKSVAALAPAELSKTLVEAGFGGICVDRNGYADNGQALEAELSRLLRTPALVHPSGRWSFFRIDPFEFVEPAQLQARQDVPKPVGRSQSSGGAN